jgi:hypothetical protein
MLMTAFDSDELLKQFLERTIGADSELAATRLLKASIPPGVKAYLRAHLRERLGEELGRAPSFSRIRAASPSAARLQHLFIEQAADAYVYARAEFQTDLENAVHFTENYVCRPRWTLSSFLFHTGDVIGITELFAKLDYVSDYVYLPQLLRKTLAARGAREIGRGQCTELIRRIDAAVVKEHAPRELAALAKPLFDFYSAGDQGLTQEVPLRLVLLFFEDKEMVGVREYIAGIYHFRNKESIGLDDLAALCDDFLGTSKDVVPLNEVESGTPAPETVAVPVTEPVPVPEPDAIATESPALESVVLTDAVVPPLIALSDPEVSAQTEDPETKTVTPAEPIVEHADVFLTSSEDIPTGAPEPEPTADSGPETPVESIQEIVPEPVRELAEMSMYETPVVPELPPVLIAEPPVHHAVKPATEEQEPEEQLELPLAVPEPVTLPDLTIVITPEQRKRFVNILCDRDADFFDVMISRLNQMDSWQDAKGYVRELFEINTIDPFQDEAIEFTDIIQQRFAAGRGPVA